MDSVKQNTIDNLRQGHKIYLSIDEVAKEPAGYIMFGKYRGEEDFCGEIMSIYFYQKFRGKGFAQELFDFAQNELKQEYKKMRKTATKIAEKGESKIVINHTMRCYM